MKGVTDFYLENKIDQLYDCLKYAIENPENLSTKIDGKPALIIWSKFPGLKDNGVGFKSLIKQVQENRAKDYFNDESSIINFMNSKSLSEEEKQHRTKSFISALQLSNLVKPNCLIWGDVLFVDGEVSQKDNIYTFQPNTITYEIDSNIFPNIKNSKFGIVFHTVVNSDFSQNKITNINNFLSTNNDFIICPSDIKTHSYINKELLNKLDNAYSKATKLSLLFNDNFLKELKKACKNAGFDKEKIMSNLKNVDLKVASNVIDNLFEFNLIKEDILNNSQTQGINSYIDGNKSIGEGFVINIENCEPLKLVSDDGFTKYNIKHMNSLKERIINNGNTVVAWSSSKDTKLFNYYLSRNLKYGDNGGSNYGFATYLVTEPPFTEGAQVGYSDEYRRKLYGDNIFEFEIPTDRIIFFDYQDYLKSKQGQEQKASFDNFIETQIKALGIKMTDEEFASLKPVDESKATALYAVRLYQIMSRYFYQGHRGNLRTPIDGFQYRGRNDGNTLVIWNSNRLIPVKYSNDLGQTWQECDKNSEAYKDYLEAARIANYTYNEPNYKKSIFDGNKTPEKEEIYRYLMAYNSNDGVNEKGKSLGLSDGIFYNIVIKDDKTINASFKFNLPYVDYGEHFFRLRKNQFLDKIYQKGYKLGHLNCGIKIGSIHNPEETWESVEDNWWPESVDGGFKVVNLPITKSQFKCNTKLGKKTLYLTKCQIIDDVFDGWNVILDTEKPNSCSSVVKKMLCEKYDWAENLVEENTITESAIKRFKLEEKKNAITPEIENTVNKILSDNNLTLMTKSSPVVPTEDLNKALVTHNDNTIPEVYIRSKDFSSKSRPITIENFIKYCKDNGHECHYDEMKNILVTIDGVTINLRFRKEYDRAGHANSLSANRTTELYESAICHVINNFNNYNFTKIEGKNNLTEVRAELVEKFDKNFEDVDMSYVKTVCYVSKFLVREMNKLYNKSIVAEKSESKISNTISNLLTQAAIRCKWQSYKAWCVADIWIYSPGDKESIKNELNSIIKEPNEDKAKELLYSTIYNFRENHVLLGVSLKKLVNFDSELDLELGKSKTIKDWKGIIGEEEDDFQQIKGSKEAKSLTIWSKWSYNRSGYMFRSPDFGKQGGAKFNYTNEASQNTWVPSSNYCYWPEIADVFGSGSKATSYFNRVLTPEEIRNFANKILKWNYQGSEEIISENLTNYLKGLISNPDNIFSVNGEIKKENTNNRSSSELNAARTKCNNLLLMYVFVMISDKKRDSLCTKIMYYTRSLVGKGAYVYIHNKKGQK